MSNTKPALDLHFETLPEEERRPFHISLYPIFEEDEKRQGLAIPEYNYRPLNVAAKNADGQLVGGIMGDTAWNELHISAVAVNPDAPVRGAGAALMQYAERLARTGLHCNHLRTEVFSWQPRSLFEAMGYSVFTTQPDHPHGHSKYFMEKVWSVESAKEEVVAKDYERAATGLTFEEWDATVCAETLGEWINRDTVRRTAASPYPVPTLQKELFAVKVTHGGDGSLAAGVVCLVVWNELHINVLAVVPTEQRRGVGTAAMQELDAVARERHCAYIVLETSSWQGRPFYEKNGFVVFHTQDGVPPGFQRHRLSRKVPGT